MAIAGLSLPLVFAAGVVSFLSPCVLPLVPGYLSVVGRADANSPRLARSSSAFFGGFLAVFLALGASASLVGQLLAPRRTLLDEVAGVLFVAFGAALAIGVWPTGPAGRIAAAAHGLARRRGGAGLLGAAFAVSWTPCVGPVLGSILSLAGTTASVGAGAALLGVYGLGLIVPFAAVGLGFSRLTRLGRRMRRLQGSLDLAGGAVLIATGVLLLTHRLYVVNAEAEHALQALRLDWWSAL
jgi:cytochrome c-type biogenesis protein